MQVGATIVIDGKNAEQVISDIQSAIKKLTDTSGQIQSLDKMKEALRNIEKVIQELQQVALGKKIMPDLNAEQAKQAITKFVGQYKDLEKEIGAVEKATDGLLGKTKEVDSLSLSATIQNLDTLSSKLDGISSTFQTFGKSAMDKAEEIGGLETAIIRLSNSAEEGQKVVKFIKDLSLTPQEFSTEALLESGKILSDFKLDVEALLPKLSDFADVKMKDVTEVTNTFAKALTGTRGGVSQLATQFGITAEELEKYNVKMTASGEVEDDSIQTKQALLVMLDDIASKSGTAGDSLTEQFENSAMQLQNNLNLLKAELGKELLPAIIELVKNITPLVKSFNDLDEGTRKSLIQIVAYGGGILVLAANLLKVVVSIGSFITSIQAIGPAFNAVRTAITAYTASMGGLTVGFGAISGILYGGAGIGLIAGMGLFANEVIKAHGANEKFKSDQISEEFNKIAVAVNYLNKEYNQSGGAISSVNAVLSEGAEKLKQQADGYLKVQEAVKLTVVQEQQYNDQVIADKQRLSEIAAEEESQNRNNIAITKEHYEAREKEKAQLNEHITILEKHIQKQQEDRKELQSFASEIKGTAGEVKQATEEMKKSLHGEDFSALISHEKLLLDAQKQTRQQMIDNLENYKGRYKLTEDQILEIDKIVIEERKKIAEEEKKVIEAREKAEKEAIQQKKKTWEDFIKALRVALQAGEISQKQYNEAISRYLKEHVDDFKNNNTLKLEIEKEYYSGVNTLAKTEQAEKKKQLREELKEEKEHQKRRIEEAKKQLEEEKKLVEERRKAELQITADLIKINQGEFEAKKASIEQQVEEYRKAGVSEIEIAKWKTAQISEIEKQKIKLNRDILEASLAMELENQNKYSQFIQRRILTEKEAQIQIRAEAYLTYSKAVEQIEQQAEEYKKAGAAMTLIEQNKADAILNLQLKTFEDFKTKEEAKRKEIEDTAQKIIDVDDEIAEKKKRLKEVESEGAFKKYGTTMPGMEDLFETKTNASTADLDREKEKKKLTEDINSLEQDKLDLLEKQKTAQEELNTLLATTNELQNYIKNSSPWKQEEKDVRDLIEAIGELNQKKSSSDMNGGDSTSDLSGTGDNYSNISLTSGNQANTSQISRTDQGWIRPVTDLQVFNPSSYAPAYNASLLGTPQYTIPTGQLSTPSGLGGSGNQSSTTNIFNIGGAETVGSSLMAQKSSELTDLSVKFYS